MIAIFSHLGDDHTQAVISRLQAADRPHVVVDFSELPDRATLSVELSGDGTPHLVLERAEGPSVELDQCRSAWWRRPQSANPTLVRDPRYNHFARSEWAELTSGLCGLLPVRWMNHPVSDAAASRKPLQLRLAAAVGLTTPATLATNDPARARAFIEQHGVGKTISKSFLATHEVWRHTSLVTPEDYEQLDRVAVCPVMFQELVEGVDLRVTVVGRCVFAMAIDATRTSSPYDFRPVLGEASTSVAELPIGVETALTAVLTRLGLEYGAFDLRLTPSGDYVFLEVNTAGEFLFVERLTGLPITEAVANHLALVSPNLRSP